MLNRVVFQGRLTDNVEISYTQAGKMCGRFSIACERDFKDAQGNKQVDFFNCTAWEKLAEVCQQYLAKGGMCVVDGRLETRKSEGKTYYNIVAERVHFMVEKKQNDNAHDDSNEGVIDSNDGLPF